MISEAVCTPPLVVIVELAGIAVERGDERAASCGRGRARRLGRGIAAAVRSAVAAGGEHADSDHRHQTSTSTHCRPPAWNQPQRRSVGAIRSKPGDPVSAPHTLSVDAPGI